MGSLVEKVSLESKLWASVVQVRRGEGHKQVSLAFPTEIAQALSLSPGAMGGR